jgi:Arm DNA-binding domain
MPTIELNKRNIDSLKPEANRYTAWDSEISGFGLRITPNGRRVYILKYRVGGRQGWITIGRHGSPWTPKEARIEAQRLMLNGFKSKCVPAKQQRQLVQKD